MTSKIEEYTYKCGCASSWKRHVCRLHDENCVMFSSYHTKRKIRKKYETYTLYHSHIYTYLQSKVPKKLKRVLIERPNQHVLNWLQYKLTSGEIQELVILDSTERDISLDDFYHDRRINLGSFILYTIGTKDSFTCLKDVISWDYTTYLNCSIGEARLYAQGIVQISLGSTYKYFKDKAFRDAVHGIHDEKDTVCQK